MNCRKVVWLEGMPLCAQHFQQHDRFLENLINGRFLGIQPFNWGFQNLVIDTELLGIGKLGLKKCSGIFQDGTPFYFPGDEELPLPVEIPEDISNEIIYLSLPVRRPDGIEMDSDENPESLARYRISERDVKNNITLGGDGRVPLYTGGLKTRLLMERDERSGYTCIGVARIIEARADKNVLLDENYIPSNVNCVTTKSLKGYILELIGLLNIRGEAIAARMGGEDQEGIAGISDFLLLQTVNRYQQLFKHLSALPELHPERFYQFIIQLSGELVTFFSKKRRPKEYPPYRHNDLQQTFTPVMEDLRQLLAKVYEQRAVPIKLTDPKYNTYAARRPDPGLLQSAVFVLAAKARVDNKALQENLPNQTIIAPVETINEYIKSLTPGIDIHHLPVVPQELPYHPGFIYFELNTQCDLWDKIITSAGIAIHISSNLPELQLEFWAIKKG